jgi:hypothetical protein
MDIRQVKNCNHADWLLVVGYWLLVIGCWLLVIAQTTNSKKQTTKLIRQ